MDLVAEAVLVSTQMLETVGEEVSTFPALEMHDVADVALIVREAVLGRAQVA